MQSKSRPCIGCEIAAGRLTPPGGFVAETPHFLVHHDPEVLVPGFFVIAAKAHVRSLADLSREGAEEFARLIVSTRRAMAGFAPGQDVTLVQEERSAHLHAWLFPRSPAMAERFGQTLSTIRDAMADATRRFVGEQAEKAAADAAVRARTLFSVEAPASGVSTANSRA